MFRTVAKEELRVPGKIEYLGELRDFVTRVGKKYDFSERIVSAFKLSIDEAATNIIKHAYRDWDGDVTLRVMAKRNSLTMVLIDQGKYFDPRQVKSPDLQRYVDIGKRGGLGIFIMRRLLDDIDYRKTEEGNELWMVKKRDEEKKKKMSFTSIPLSLKMRYWFYSLTIFTIILAAVFGYSLINNKNRVLNNYINRGRLASESLENMVTNYWNSSAVTPAMYKSFKESGIKEAGIVDGALNGIEAILDSEEYSSIISEVTITNKNDLIIASSDSGKTYSMSYDSLTIPQDVKPMKEYEEFTVYILQGTQGEKVLDVVWPIWDTDKTELATTHFQIKYSLIERDISRYVRGLIGELLLIWVIVSAGLFLLIYVVMNPFRRLQDWVKKLSEPGIVEEVDIDSSTEIGAIAQAFSDVTEQLKKSQVDLAEQERLQQEMHIAKQIQQTLLPDQFPELEGYDLSSFYAAAKDVGGDFFDFVEVDQDTLGVAVADVSGKGVPGAFVMTMIRTALRSEARGVKDAAEVLAKVNEFVVNDMRKGMFVTLFYLIIDSKRRRLNFASAGHNPMVLHRPSKNKTYYLNPRGFPIGISLPDNDLFRKSIQSDTIALAEDDIVLVYTDGVTEAMNPKRRLYGDERFLKLVRNSGKLSADDFVDALKKDLNTFTEGNEQNDDITLVAIKEKMSAERVEYDRAVRAYQLIQDGTGIKEACRDVGISTYSYYQKYKETFDSEGIGIFSATDTADQIESKHLSIEEKNKIFDIVRRFPEYGAKRIAEELNTERYENTVLPVSRIYEELVRSRLNTKELREAYVQRGGKKKRLKPPGTPMMRIDGEIIMNRQQYFEPADDDDDVEKTPDTQDEIAGEPYEQQAKAEDKPRQDEPLEERSTPNVFSMDKETLMTAPLEEIFEKRPIEEEAEQGGVTVDDEVKDHKAAEIDDEDDEDYDALFGFVEKDAFEEPDEEESERFTIVSEKELQNIKDDELSADDEIGQIEEHLYAEDDELELLSNFSDDRDDDFGLEFSFGDSDGDEHEHEFLASDDTTDDTLNEDEIFDLETELDLEDDQEADFEFTESSDDKDDQQISNDQRETVASDSNDDAMDEFKELLIDDEKLFDLWAEDSSENSPNNGSNGKNGTQNSDYFSDDYEFADPFEEFLEIEDEHGLIGEDGDIDREIAEQLLQSDSAFVDFSDDDNDGREQHGDETANRDQDQYNPNDTISLDELVSVSSDDEDFFSQHDEDFDKLIQDAISNDGSAQDLFSENSSNDQTPYEQNEIIEKELKDALVLYGEAQFDKAITKLNDLAERFPHDHRAHALLGNAYFREKKFKQASSEYERVIDLDPMNEKACENLAIAYAKQGELERAIHHWERLLNIRPNRMDVRLSIQRAKAFLENY